MRLQTEIQCNGANYTEQVTEPYRALTSLSCVPKLSDSAFSLVCADAFHLDKSTILRRDRVKDDKTLLKKKKALMDSLFHFSHDSFHSLPLEGHKSNGPQNYQ